MTSLFDSLPPHVARSPTSRAAADSVASRTGEAEAKLLGLFREAGDAGLTDGEIAAHFGWSGDFARPRRWTLTRAGKVRNSGETRLTESGRAAAVWCLVDL